METSGTEIKTVYKRLSADFDASVNYYLAEGWRLNQPVYIDRTGWFAVLIKD